MAEGAAPAGLSSTEQIRSVFLPGLWNRVLSLFLSGCEYLLSMNLSMIYKSHIVVWQREFSGKPERFHLHFDLLEDVLSRYAALLM